MSERFEILVVGGGHAGCEAALAAARMGVKTGLVTLKTDRIAHMACNPAVAVSPRGTSSKKSMSWVAKSDGQRTLPGSSSGC